MLQSILNFGLESSVCLLILIGAYYVLLRRLTFFSWMRIYLLASMIVSLIVPLINIPIWNIDLFSAEQISNISLKQNFISQGLTGNTDLSAAEQVTSNYNWIALILASVFVVYLIGFIYTSFRFLQKIKTILSYIKNNSKVKQNHYHIVSLNNTIPAFSFFNYIFINKQYENLTKNEFDTIIKHEIIHAKQLHSLDVLFIELISILFWFNPLLIYVKKSFKELHEFIVDEKLVLNGENKKIYSELLLNLATERNEISLSTGFSGQQIARRLKMIIHPRSHSFKKYLFFIFIPIVSVLLLSFSISEVKKPEAESVYQNQNKSNLTIGNIKWIGNEAYSDAVLNKTLGLKNGDKYIGDFSMILNGTVGNLYLDNGFIFYNGKIDEKVNNGIVNLEITIFEGNRGRIGNVIIKGNNNVSEEKIVGVMKLKSGDLFSRSKLIASNWAIANIKNISDSISFEVIPQLDMLQSDGCYLVNIEIQITEN